MRKRNIARALLVAGAVLAVVGLGLWTTAGDNVQDRAGYDSALGVTAQQREPNRTPAVVAFVGGALLVLIGGAQLASANVSTPRPPKPSAPVEWY